MRVENMTSSKGNAVPNQFIITDKGKEYFQSYNSIIAVKEKGQVKLDSYYWHYSVSTGKYRNDFLGENIAQTRQKIEEGTYKLTNLNK